MPIATYGWIPPSDVIRVSCPACGHDYIVRYVSEQPLPFVCWRGDFVGTLTIVDNVEPSITFTEEPHHAQS